MQNWSCINNWIKAIWNKTQWEVNGSCPNTNQDHELHYHLYQMMCSDCIGKFPKSWKDNHQPFFKIQLTINFQEYLIEKVAFNTITGIKVNHFSNIWVSFIQPWWFWCHSYGFNLIHIYGMSKVSHFVFIDIKKMDCYNNSLS